MIFQIEFNTPTSLDEMGILRKLGATYHNDTNPELKYWFIELNSLEELDAFIKKVEATLSIYWSVIVSRDPMCIHLDYQIYNKI